MGSRRGAREKETERDRSDNGARDHEATMGGRRSTSNGKEENQNDSFGERNREKEKERRRWKEGKSGVDFGAGEGGIGGRRDGDGDDGQKAEKREQRHWGGRQRVREKNIETVSAKRERACWREERD